MAHHIEQTWKNNGRNITHTHTHKQSIQNTRYIGYLSLYIYVILNYTLSILSITLNACLVNNKLKDNLFVYVSLQCFKHCRWWWRPLCSGKIPLLYNGQISCWCFCCSLLFTAAAAIKVNDILAKGRKRKSHSKESFMRKIDVSMSPVCVALYRKVLHASPRACNHQMEQLQSGRDKKCSCIIRV